MAALITSLIFLLVVVIYFLFSKLIEFYRVKSLRDLVAWSVSTDNHIRCNLSLSDYIAKAQNKLNIPNEHRITGDEEWAYTKEILGEYRQDLMFSYFLGHLIIIKSKYVISGECYFMASLYAFLCKHQCGYNFLGHDMHKKQLEYKHHGDWGNPLFDSKYEQTAFAIVLHKMHYITYMYCKGDERLKDFVPAWNEENLKEILDTKHNQISRM